MRNVKDIVEELVYQGYTDYDDFPPHKKEEVLTAAIHKFMLDDDTLAVLFLDYANKPNEDTKSDLMAYLSEIDKDHHIKKINELISNIASYIINIERCQLNEEWV